MSGFVVVSGTHSTLSFVIIQAHFSYWMDVFDSFDEILCTFNENPSSCDKRHVLAVLRQTEFILRELVYHTKYYNSIEVC